MADIFSRKKRSEIMSKIRGKNTKPELLAEKLMKENKLLRFERGDKIEGKPDFIFKRKKVAVFIDGGFWHGKDFTKIKGKLPAFWKKKISGNVARDKNVNKKLKSKGWTVLRVWDSQIKKHPEKYIRKVRTAIKR